MVAASASATVELYPDDASRVQAAVAINSTTSTLALYGPIHDETSIGALSTFKMGIMGAIAVAVLALFLVVRHTRTEEETGRLELLGATVVGRRAPLTAALLVAGGASLVAGAGTALGLDRRRDAGRRLAAHGRGLRLPRHRLRGRGRPHRAAREERADRRRPGRRRARRLLPPAGDRRRLGRRRVRLAVVAVAGRLVAADPAVRRGPLVGPRSPARPLAVAVAALAYALAARRDFAAGLLPDRPGPAAAAAGLRSPLALAWRLQRGSFFAWAAVFVVLGVVVGGMASNVGELPEEPAGPGASSPSSAA